MDFEVSETQSILATSADQFLSNEANGLARAMEKSEHGFSSDIWQTIAELGWLGVLFPEKYGGIEGNFLDFIILLEEMGKVIFPGPYIASIIAGLVVLEYGKEVHKETILPSLISGKMILSHSLNNNHVRKRYEAKDSVQCLSNKFLLNASEKLVPFAQSAKLVLYAVDTDKGSSMFLLKMGVSGIDVTPLETMANDRFCAVGLKDFNASEVDVIGNINEGSIIKRKIEEWGAIAESGFILGMLQSVIKLSVQYAKEREQFGKKIGAFQAIQHQCANMVSDIERLRLLVHHAAWRLSEGLPSRKEIAMAKAFACDAARRVSLLGIKIHGATGVSEEHDMQMFFRKSKSSALCYGNGDYFREVVATEVFDEIEN